MRLLGVFAAISLLAIVVWSCRPVCVPLSDESLAAFDTPIEERADRDFYVKVFQLRDGEWHQCKTWISRQLFF